jgi:selenide,water dikinase
VKRLLLLGGGHAHALVLRELRRKPLPGTEVTLVTEFPMHTYSGMLPGHIAGHYPPSDLQIDLARLAREAGAVLVLDRAEGLDPERRIARLESGQKLPYDLLSLNLGSVPAGAPPGLGAKPFETFIARWNNEGMKAKRIAVVGAGAAGVELAMAMRHRRPDASVVLVSDRFAFGGRLEERIRAALSRCGVELRLGESKADAEFTVWATGPAAQPWLRHSGLAVDEKGFVFVYPSLRAVSHPDVFAAGDTATIKESRHPKSGVFAVRHAPVLLENLRRTLAGEDLQAYEPQKKHLALVSCGAKYAIASRGEWSVEGTWAWRWKDWIDRRWIERFRG